MTNATQAETRPDATAKITRGAARMLRDMGYATLTEFRLASGRRVDVAGLDRRGEFVFVEVKSCRADYEADAKWTHYLGYCDRFYFAVDDAFPTNLIDPESGLVVADAFGGAVVRPSPAFDLAGARRKAVTLRFARQAADRGAGRRPP